MIDLTDVRALTLKNPWAHLIAHHGKRVENRSWTPPETCDRFLVHAGKGWDNTPFGEEWRDSLALIPTSAIVAVADIAHICDASRWFDENRCGCDPTWAMPRQFHWVLGAVRALAWPVPCTGRLGLWRPTAEVVEAVAEQLAVVPAGAGS